MTTTTKKSHISLKKKKEMEIVLYLCQCEINTFHH